MATDRGAQPSSEGTERWWSRFFDATYARVGLVPGTEAQRLALAETARHLLDRLGVAPGARVFDQCCGMGRVSHALGRLGVATIGVDQSAEYVRAAREVAAAEGLPCAFEEGDAHDFVPEAPCDAALNWFTSIGYDRDDRRSRRQLERLRDAVRPGGRVAVEFISTPWLLANFQPAMVMRPGASAEAGSGRGTGGLVVLMETTLDFERGMSVSTWTFLAPEGGRDERRVEVRLFMPHELVRLAEEAGLRVVELLSGADGRPFERTSRRLLLLAERP